MRVIQISEYNCLGRTSLLASRHNVPILNRSILLFRINLLAINALHTVAAYLHYAAAAYADVRVPDAK